MAEAHVSALTFYLFLLILLSHFDTHHSKKMASSLSLSKRVHPMLLPARLPAAPSQAWDVQFKSRISKVLDGTLSQFAVVGEFPAHSLSIGLTKYFYNDEAEELEAADKGLRGKGKARMFPVALETVKCFSGMCSRDPVVHEDLLIEVGPLETRLEAISNKVFRGYGSHSEITKNDEKTLTRAPCNSYDNLQSDADFKILPFFDFADFPLQQPELVADWDSLTRDTKASPAGLQVFVFDEGNYVEFESQHPFGYGQKKGVAFSAFSVVVEEYFKHHCPEKDNSAEIKSVLDSKNFDYYFSTKVIDEQNDRLFAKYGGKQLKEFFPADLYRDLSCRPVFVRHAQFSDRGPRDLLEGTITDETYIQNCRDPRQYEIVAATPDMDKMPGFFPPWTCQLRLSSTIPLTPLTVGLAFAGEPRLRWVLQTPSIDVRDRVVKWFAKLILPQLARNVIEVAPASLNKVDMSSMLHIASKSWFGLNEETVYDETVRKGKELKANQFQMIVGPTHAESEEELRLVLLNVQRALFPTATALYLKASKVAIYEPGGHFDVHRDTVRHQQHQGTLLVEIPSKHIGGDLVLTMQGQQITWSLSGNEDRYLDRGIVQGVKYAAFFTDVEHSIQPVESGTRAVIQYDIYVSHNEDESEDESEDENENVNEEKVGSKMDEGSTDSFKLATGYVPDAVTADLYFHTFHHHASDDDFDDYDGYTFFEFADDNPFDDSQLTPRLTNALVEELRAEVTDDRGVALPLFHLYTDTRVLYESLKASDLKVFRALVEAGFAVQIVPILIDAVSSYEGKWGNEFSYKVKSLPSVLTESECGYILCATGDSASESDHGGVVEVCMSSDRLKGGCTQVPAHYYPDKIVYAATGYEQIETLNSKEYSEHTGNEAAAAEHRYFAVAFVVTTKKAVVYPDDALDLKSGNAAKKTKK